MKPEAIRTERLKGGQTATEFVLGDGAGSELRVTDLGATITALRIAPERGPVRNVVLGFEHLSDYALPGPYFGATIGRVAGRIPDGRFRLGDRIVELPQNEGTNHLHGGFCGLDKRVWRRGLPQDGDGLVFHYTSPHGEEGYPGTVDFSVRYSFPSPASLRIIWEATPVDQTTPVCLTNHAYFNLGDSQDTLDHEVEIPADEYFPVNEDFVPLPEPLPVQGDGADLRRPRILRDAVGDLHAGHGDLYLLRPATGCRPAARLTCPSTGYVLTVSTDEPCLQFYTGNSLEPGHAAFAGVCFECQANPGAIGHPGHGAPLVPAGTKLRREIRYEFSTLKTR